MKGEVSLAKKAKYKIKQSGGTYEIIHFETSAEQILETNGKQFVTKAQKQQIDSVNAEMERLKAENEQLRSLVEGISSQLEKIQSDLNNAKTRVAWTVVKS